MTLDPNPSCPVCEGREVRSFLARSNVPVFQNVLFKYRKDALNTDRGSLQLAACKRCGFVFNTAFEAHKARYTQVYDNDQTYSAEFANYASEHVRRLVDDHAVRDASIVEVGCGNGWFLEKLVAASANSVGFGFDPAYRGPDESLAGRVRYERRYFEPGDAALRADVVLCRHVIEHVPDPVALLRSVRAAVQGARRPRVFFETPCIEWILRNQVIWDFFYEHCSYFSEGSLTTAFNRAGFDVARIEHVFGGQYLWLEATPMDTAFEIAIDPGEIPELARAFGEAEPHLRDEWLDRVEGLGRDGKVAIWGAGAKGVTFLNLLDPDASRIDCAVDVNPDKQNRYVPGTGHRVVAVAQLPERGIATAVLMNPNYRAENISLLAAAHAAVELVG